MIAPAGLTLLFADPLIHAAGQLRSDRERAMIINGYGSTMFPYGGGSDLSPKFAGKIPANLGSFYHGKAHWPRGPRYRNLGDPADPRTFTLADGWQVGK